MKRIFLLTLAGVLTISSFAADKGKQKIKKNRKAHATEQVCPPGCPKSNCSKA